MSGDASPALFDALARDYDEKFSDRAPARKLRSAVHTHLAEAVIPGSRVLDVGCGTGIDAVWLAEQGCRVYATDISEGMLEIARLRARRSEAAGCIEFAAFDASRPEPHDLGDAHDLDLVFANFGALNCIEELRPFFSFAHSRLKPQGIVAVTIMGRFCLWETIYFMFTGRPRKAIRRWSGRSRFDSGSASQTIWYHRPRDVIAAALRFDKLSIHGIGALLPSSEAFEFCERHPALLEQLARLDSRFGHALPWIADHYVLFLKRI